MPLSEIQLRAATIVLALPEADGFALAGGAARDSRGGRPRHERSRLFGPSTDAVNALVGPAMAALADEGLTVQVVVRHDGFAKAHRRRRNRSHAARLRLRPCNARTRGLDRRSGSAPARPCGRQTPCVVRPRRVSRLRGRCRPPRPFRQDDLCAIARSKDLGFNLDVLADAFGVLPRYDRDDEYPALTDDEHLTLLRIFADWQQEIRSR